MTISFTVNTKSRKHIGLSYCTHIGHLPDGRSISDFTHRDINYKTALRLWLGLTELIFRATLLEIKTAVIRN